MIPNCNFFVYGTLKRGQRNEVCWPCRPNQVSVAWTFGSLFDLGPYPAMLSGEDRVLGELWSFDAEHVLDVLASLDELEGTNVPNQPDLYSRHCVAVQLLDGSPPEQAWTYFYERDVSEYQYLGAKVHSDGNRYAEWPGPGTPESE